MSGQDATHAGGRALREAGSLPHFLARDWIPDFSATAEAIAEIRRRHRAVIDEAWERESELIALIARYGREDEETAAAERALLEPGAGVDELDMLEITGSAERRIRLQVARQRFAVALAAACDEVLQLAGHLRSGPARAELLAIADAGLQARPADRQARIDGTRARVFLFEEIERAYNLEAAASRVRRMLAPYAERLAAVA